MNISAVANEKFMTVHGISHEEVERAIRLLALCSLGAQQSVLPYALIATALKVNMQMTHLYYNSVCF